jgi:hypothetical protein
VQEDESSEYESSDTSQSNENLDQSDNLKRKREPSIHRDSTISANDSIKCDKCPFKTNISKYFQEHVRNHQPRLIKFN